MELIIQNDGLYQLVVVTKEMTEHILLLSPRRLTSWSGVTALPPRIAMDPQSRDQSSLCPDSAIFV